MISRRDFWQASVAAAALLGAGGLPLQKLAAQQRLTQQELLKFDSKGKVTIVHLTDIHAQLRPVYFREPSTNIGVGEVRGLAPHLTGQQFLKAFAIAPKSAMAYGLTSEDFVGLAKEYGRMGGLDRIATIVKAIRAERGDKVLLLDGGDTWHGSWTALKTKGQDMVEAMALLKPDAMTGHWEFTLGAARVKEITESQTFPFLAQNIRDSEFDDIVFEPRKVFERGGAKIAVIGQAFPYTPISNPRWMIPSWTFGIQEEKMQKQVDDAKAEGADLVVLLSHNGFDVDRKMAGRVKGIDVLLSAHTHDALPDVTKVGSTLIVATGSNGKFVSRLDLEIANKSITSFNYRLIPIFSDAITPDTEMAALIARHRAPFETDLKRVLARSDDLLYRRGNFAGTLDDVICDAMLSERDAEIALSPGVRWGTSILPGQAITFEDVTNATAMTYPANYRMTMTGERLKNALEDVADNIFNPDPYYQGGGDMVRTGGLGFTIDVSKSIGQRISNMTHLASDKPIDAARNYVVTGWASINETVEGPPIWETVEKYLLAKKTIHSRSAETVRVLGA